MDDFEPCRADNRTHTYCWAAEFDSSALRNAADYAMQNLADETLMAKKKIGCDSKTDIHWHTFAVPAYYAQAPCKSTADTSERDECQRYSIQLNPTAINETSSPANARKATTCHEVGHTVGLYHGTGHADCMSNSNPSSRNQHYDAHHEQHINGAVAQRVANLRED